MAGGTGQGPVLHEIFFSSRLPCRNYFITSARRAATHLHFAGPTPSVILSYHSLREFFLPVAYPGHCFLYYASWGGWSFRELSRLSRSYLNPSLCAAFGDGTLYIPQAASFALAIHLIDFMSPYGFEWFIRWH